MRVPEKQMALGVFGASPFCHQKSIQEAERDTCPGFENQKSNDPCDGRNSPVGRLISEFTGVYLIGPPPRRSRPRTQIGASHLGEKPMPYILHWRHYISGIYSIFHFEWLRLGDGATPLNHSLQLGGCVWAASPLQKQQLRFAQGL